MNFSIKTAVIFFVSLILLTGLGFAIYVINADIFFALGWFVVFSALMSRLTVSITKRYVTFLMWSIAVVATGTWFFYNESLFLLISTSVNSNPYGEYFLGQFEFRLLLSIFVLKAILKMWLTDARLLLAAILVVFQFAVLTPALRFLLMSIPSRFFEFVVAATSHLKIEFRRYISVSLGIALVNSILWCLAAFFLQFDNFILMTFIMLLFSFIPRIGLFVGAAISLLFVESGLFLIQMGGMLIALASMWFIDHTLFKDQELLDKTIPLVILALLPAAGYLIIEFIGLFLAAPIIYVSVLFTKNISKNLPLIHKPLPPIPRNA